MTVEWFRVNVEFVENAKVTSVPIATRWFHLAALSYCARNLTDGHLSARQVKIVAAICDLPARRHTTALVKAKLWRHDDEGDGFWINDYLVHQPSRSQVKQIEENRKRAGAIGGKASGQARRKANASNQVLKQVVEPQDSTRQEDQGLLRFAPFAGLEKPSFQILKEIRL